MFSIWVAETCSFDFLRSALLLGDHRVLLLAHRAFGLLLGRTRDAFEAELVVANVWARSVSNYFVADGTRIIHPLKLVQDPLLLVPIDGVEHSPDRPELIKELLFLQSQLVHLALAHFQGLALLHESLEGIVMLANVQAAFFAGL